MELLKNRNVNGDVITIQQTQEITNLGQSTIRKLAKESGAERKIGRSYRIKKTVLLDYIDKMFS